MITTFLATLNPMLMLFLCIAVGYALRTAKILDDHAGKTMAKLVTWVFSPALNFSVTAKNCTVETISTHATNILLETFGVAVALGLSIAIAPLIIRKKGAERGVYLYALAFANNGYIGDPLVLALFGDKALAFFKIFCLPLTIAIYTWGLSVLIPDGEKKGNALKKILNAPTVALLLGMAVGLSGLGAHIPVFLNNSLDTLKVCMGPTGMLLAGFTVANYSLKAMLKNKKVYVATFLRLTVLPSIIIGAIFGLKEIMNAAFSLSIDNSVLHLAFFATAAPLGLNTIIFPEAFGGNPKTGAGMTLISHTLCVISIPIMYALLTLIFGPITIA